MTDTTRPVSAIREAPLGSGGSVEILLTSNAVRIRGTEGDRVIVRTRGGEDIDEEIRIDGSPGQIRIRDAEAGLRLGPLRWRTRRSADLDIDLPRTAALSLRTLSGDVEAVGIGGPSRWGSASGDLRIAVSAGPVAVESMSGNAVLEASGPLSLTARTVSGDLRVRAPLIEMLEASSVSGDIRIEAALGNGAGHAISSVSGDVDLVTTSPVRVETQTIAGDVRATGLHAAEGGRGRRTLVLGDGSIRVTVRTTSGDIRLRGTAPGTAPLPVTRSAPVAQVAPVAPGEPVAPDAPAAPDAPVAPEAAPGPPWLGDAGSVDRSEATRLEVLRALERGELDVEAATRRLEALEFAGPRSFRGWC